MTDEELGRAWCERHGKRIEFSRAGYWLEGGLMVAGVNVFYGRVPHRTESTAYAALGSALRRLVEFAGEVREVMVDG